MLCPCLDSLPVTVSALNILESLLPIRNFSISASPHHGEEETDTLSWKVSYSGACYILRQLEIESEGNSNVKPLSDVGNLAEDY